MFDHRLREGWEREPLGIRARIRCRYRTERRWINGLNVDGEPRPTPGRWALAMAEALEYVASLRPAARLERVHCFGDGRMSVMYSYP